MFKPFLISYIKDILNGTLEMRIKVSSVSIVSIHDIYTLIQIRVKVFLAYIL